MIYVKRNINLQIEDIIFTPEIGYQECSLFDSDIQAFLNNQDNEALVKEVLAKLDNDMVRVIEDVVELLIEKNIMLFTDLPEPVQNKLIFKRSIRESLQKKNESALYDEDSIIHF